MQRSFFFAFVLLLTASPAWAEGQSATEEVDLELDTALSAIPQLSAVEQPATTLEAWMTEIAQSLTQVTNVQVNATTAGLNVTLESTGPLEQPTTSVVGNALIINISNAVLALPQGNEFQQANPIEEIALLSVTALPGNRVQVVITGVDYPPRAELTLTTQALVLAVAPGTEAIATGEEAIQVVAVGQQDEGYNPTQTGTATGLDTPLRDVPLSIQVIPQQVLEDRSVTELGAALETAGGVVSAGGRGVSGFGPGFLIRGFETRGGIFRDGIQTHSLAPLSTTDLERVEVLRGPASVLFGQGEPGGIINLVPKRPLSVPFYEVSGQAGSFSTYQGALDLTGPLNADRTVRYRLNLSYENFGSFRDFVNGERVLISPIVTWDIGPNTSLDLYGQYTYDRETIDEGLPVGSGGILDLPRSRFLNEPFGEFTQDQFNVGYRLNHNLSEIWSLRHTLQYQQFSPQRYAPLFDDFNETTGELERSAYAAGGTYERFLTNAEAIARFNTGPVQHQVLAGIEYRNNLESPNFRTDVPYTPINVFNPVYARRPYPIEPNFFRDDRISTFSVYLQDQIDLLPNLNLLAGIRYDAVDQFRTTQSLGNPRREFEQTDSAFSPRVGLVYRPVDPVSLYASYTTSFRPSFAASLNVDGSTFDPERGRQFEVGVKADLTDQLSFTAAAFDIRRQNVRTPDRNNPRFSVQTGEVASRGLEFTLGGEVTPGWNITTAYTLLDAFVSRDNRDIVGNQLANVPDHQFSLWTTYEIQAGGLQGLGVGLGLFYLSDRPGNLDNTFNLPSFFRTDAALFYRRNNWQAQLNVENLFDIRYFTVSDQFLGVTPGAPLRVSGRVSVEF